MKSKKQGDNAEVYFMGTESNIQGLAIIVTDPKELTVVNIVGPIDIEELSKLSGHMGVPYIKIDKSPAHKEAKGEDKKP